jgi:uncharacterized membrane protein HdeD (DUF308 family)
MLYLLARNWWVFGLRSMIAIVFGMVVLLFPEIAIRTFILLFAFYGGTDGFFAIWSFFERNNLAKRGWQMLQGVISILAAILAVLYPGITALIMLYVIAARAVCKSLSQFISGAKLKGNYGSDCPGCCRCASPFFSSCFLVRALWQC